MADGPLGLLGGTFDPIHHGHLRLAEELYEALTLDELRLLPAGTPPHRPAPAATAAHRLAMIERAVADNPRLGIETHEIETPGAGYMVDTLAALRDRLGDQRPLVLLLGADAFAGLAGWHDWRRLFELAHLAVALRPGHGGDDWETRLPSAVAEVLAARRVTNPGALRQTPAGTIYCHAITQLDISASHIRELLRRGRSVRYLLPSPVIDYITERRLYL